MTKHVGVIGAGQMGAGIAQVMASSGLLVTLCDVSDASLKRALQNISKRVEKSILEKITTTSAISSLSNCEVVIEAVPENYELKMGILRELDEALPSSSVIASNTSSISITRLASATKRPKQFMGMHFMNPVPVMTLVELIRGMATSDETYVKIVSLAEKVGKVTTTSEDRPGFIANRILMPMINEAFFVLMESVATREDIDETMKLGARHPMGPLTLADFIGLDTCLAIMQVLHGELGDSKYRPCPLLRQYVDAGFLGKKSGRGVYAYDL